MLHPAKTEGSIYYKTADIILCIWLTLGALVTVVVIQYIKLKFGKKFIYMIIEIHYSSLNMHY